MHSGAYRIAVESKPVRNRDETSFFVGHISHSGARGFKQEIEEFLSQHCETDPQHRDVASLYSDDMTAARALLFRHFKSRWLFYDDAPFEFISSRDLPAREPDEKGEGYALWVDEKKTA